MATETPVRFTRGTTNEINRVKIVDGQLLYDTQTGKMYQDVGSRRISIGGGTALTLKKLTFTGASHAVYDGSAPVSVNIPQSGGGGGQGLSEEEKNLIITIMRSGLYSSDQSKNITKLETLFNGEAPVETWSVANNLTHCTTNNGVSFVAKNASYSANLSANSGYTMDGATVSVKMGGVDITSSAYKNGAITIESVTGDVVITAAAIESGSESQLVTDGLGDFYDYRSAVPQQEEWNLAIKPTVSVAGRYTTYPQKESSITKKGITGAPDISYKISPTEYGTALNNWDKLG